MEHSESVYPKARRSGLLIDHVREETIVYDEERQEAHSLNRAAGFVWSHSDGTRSVQQLATMLASELQVEPNESLVEYALEELERVHLLEPVEGTSVSRREVVRRLAFAGATAVAMPVVLSVIAPTPAMAASGTQNSQGQNNNNQGPNQQ